MFAKKGIPASAAESHFTNKKGTQVENCMVCGETLAYHEKSVDVACNYCGKLEHGYIKCPKGHYICDHCHNKDSMRVIEDMMFKTESDDPFAIAELAMSFPGLTMLGCQHAYIAGGALMAALKNKRGGNVTDDDIKEVFKRTQKQAHGGYCGLTGVCGIAPAIGACFAVLTGSKCGTDTAQRTTMEVVSKVTRAITELTGPSCCKAYVRAALKTAVESLENNFKVVLSSGRTTDCRYSSRHPHGCRKSKCPYFTLSGKNKTNLKK